MNRTVLQNITEDSMTTIALDFDGVIHKYSKGWQDGSCYDVPMEGAIEMLTDLLEHYNVCILSTRDCQQIEDWLKKYAPLLACQILPFHQIRWERKGVVGITNRKILAEMYIDDRAVTFTNWKDVKKMLL